MFTREQKKQVRQALHVRSDCPNCGLEDWWRLNDDLVSLPPAGDSLEAPGLNLLAITCRECGHTQLFSAAAVGVLSPERQTVA